MEVMELGIYVLLLRFDLNVRVCFFACTQVTYGIILAIVMTCFSSILIALMHPYKNNVYNILDTVIFFMLHIFTTYCTIIYYGFFLKIPFIPILIVFIIYPHCLLCAAFHVKRF